MQDSHTEELRILRQQVQEAQDKARLFEEQYRMARIKLIKIGKLIYPYGEDSSPTLNTGTGKDFTDNLMLGKKTQ